MDDARFAKKVRKELGEEINPIYVAELLKKDIPGLLRWLQQEQNLGAILQVSQETLIYTEAHREPQDKDTRRTLHLGVRILEGDYKLGLFLIKEIKRRLEVVDDASVG